MKTPNGKPTGPLLANPPAPTQKVGPTTAARALGYAQQKDLLQITCALITNDRVYSQSGVTGLVAEAKKILTEIEAQDYDVR